MRSPLYKEKGVLDLYSTFESRHVGDSCPESC